jgi:hypothetical protein
MSITFSPKAGSLEGPDPMRFETSRPPDLAYPPGGDSGMFRLQLDAPLDRFLGHIFRRHAQDPLDPFRGQHARTPGSRLTVESLDATGLIPLDPLVTVLRDTLCARATSVGLYLSRRDNKIRARLASPLVVLLVFSQPSKIVLAHSVRTSIRKDAIFSIRKA